MKKLIIVLILLVTPLLASASVLQDSSFYPEGSTDYEDSCIADGSCSLDQGFNTFVVLSKWGLGILGSFALLFFIFGGIMWLTSGGKSGKIEKGKDIMVNTVIGIVIVMGAWLIVQTILVSISTRSLENTNTQVAGPCDGLQENDSCRSGLGICINNDCVQKCDATPPEGGGYACRNSTQCVEGTIVSNMCFGPNNIVCCQSE
ncbi:MAG: pilin [Candidatus Komeilibacteria bacterium]